MRGETPCPEEEELPPTQCTEFPTQRMRHLGTTHPKDMLDSTPRELWVGILLWEETHRQWEEMHRQWEETHRQWEETHRQWEETHRQWEETHRQWEETHRQWEETHRLWEETHRKWEEEVCLTPQGIWDLPQGEHKRRLAAGRGREGEPGRPTPSKITTPIWADHHRGHPIRRAGRVVRMVPARV